MSADGGQATLSDLKEGAAGGCYVDRCVARRNGDDVVRSAEGHAGGAGLLDQIKARIRAEIFAALDDQDVPKPKLSNENLIINELIREYFEYNGYRHALFGFLTRLEAFSLDEGRACEDAANSGQPAEKPFDRQFLSSELNVTEDPRFTHVPLLYSIAASLQQKRNQEQQRERDFDVELQIDQFAHDNHESIRPCINLAMISALAWVPKGASRRIPEKLKLTDDEVKMLREAATEEEEEEQSAMEAAMAEEDAEQQNQDEKDNNGGAGAVEEEEDDETADQPDEEGNVAMEDDEDEQDDELEMDKDDVEIRPTDSVILVTNTEEDFSNLEVQVYDDENGALYVHHEINLPAFPLCMAWMDCAPVPLNPTTGPVDGSFVAVGTFKPGIEIWDLNVLDDLRDVAMPKISKRRKNRKTALKPGSHQDAVMSLDWNSSHRNMLASGSGDSTVKVWDITTQKCLYTMAHHSNKVQSVRWNPAETTVLASASFDRTLVVLDGRQPDAFSKFQLSAEVESIAWAPHNPSTIVASSEDGVVVGFDVRMNGSAPLFRFDAHAGAVSAISFSAQVPGLLATAGVDKTVKLWDLKDNAPVCVTSKEMNVGELFTLSFYQDSPFMLGVGGSKGVLALWDTSENEGVERRFGSRRYFGSFRSPYQLGEELALEEEREKQQQGKKKSGKGKKGKKN
ncbi:G-protein beta WD-40 repeat [Phytophthora cactorum]|nr:G-protein beta WD-40 repeat [Phytophthora cactorum]